jgi:hypothetical protein
VSERELMPERSPWRCLRGASPPRGLMSVMRSICTLCNHLSSATF